MTCLLRILSGLTIILCSAATAQAQIASPMTCGRAIAASERAEGLPPQMLGAIGVMESGRVDPRTGLAAPWPWTINVAGIGRMFDTAADAIAAVQAAQAAGAQSIDVGCMQINLAAHPAAFDSLDTAFEPAANADYAARFLRTLYQQSGRFSTAMTAYHSQTPEFANDYARRLLAVWPGAAELGLTADPTPPVPPQQRASQINLDTEAGRAIAVRPVSLRTGSRRPDAARPQVGLASIHGGAWPH